MTRALFALSLIALLAGCGASSYQRVPMPPQDVELSSPKLARIYIVRHPQVRGSLEEVQVFEADTEIGAVVEGDYLCWERPPGQTLVTLVYVAHGLKEDREGILDLQCDAGITYYYAIKLGADRAKPRVELLPQEEGRQLISQRNPAPHK